MLFWRVSYRRSFEPVDFRHTFTGTWLEGGGGGGTSLDFGNLDLTFKVTSP